MVLSTLVLATLAVAAADSKAATITAAPTASAVQPWFFKSASEQFVSMFPQVRASGVSEQEASSIAKHLFDYGVDHPQYTQLAREALQMWVSDGDQPNPTSLYNIAAHAETAYEDIHNSVKYWDYIAYVHSTALPAIDMKKVMATPTFHADPSISAAISTAVSSEIKHAKEVYSSLLADPTGSSAVSILSKVGTQYYKDFVRPSSRKGVPSSLIEKAVSKILNVI